MQQPPPRKVKPTVQCKNVHSEQLSKLQHKHQHEYELLEDIRAFSSKRAALEREYAQSLCKLAQHYLAKKIPTTPDLPGEDGNSRTLTQVWKTVLEETERVAKMRQNAADIYHTDIAEAAKPIKTNKAHTAKKVMSQVSTLQKELAQSVLDLAETQKCYNTDEHVSHEARTKAADADAKVKNKSTGIFTSLAKLQQNSAKLNNKKDLCEVKSTSARNDYVLSLASANAHWARYHNVELPELLEMLDGEMYDKVREFFITLSRTELECCGLTQECFMKILTDSALISRDYNLRCFLHENPVFTDQIQYKFEAQDSDQISTISQEHSDKERMEAEAQKWSKIVARDNKTIRMNQRDLDLIKSGHCHQRKPSESSSIEGKDGKDKNKDKDKDKENGDVLVDVESKSEEIKQNIRKAELSRLKAEAKLDALRSGGINVEYYLDKANAEVMAEPEEPSRYRASSMSMSAKTDSSDKSPRESTVHEDARESVTQPNDSTYINYEEEDDFQDETFANNTAATTQGDANDTQTASMVESNSTGYSSGRTYPISCVALYDFQASNNDELTMSEGQAVTLIADGDGDGWVRAQTATGETGFIPENYIQMLDSTTSNGPATWDQNDVNAGWDANEMNVDVDTPVHEPTVTTTVAEINSPPATTNGFQLDLKNTTAPQERNSNYSATDYEVQNTVAQSPVTDAGPWARALYDYEATCEEELTFLEGQMIRILRKEGADGVDDGWWEGEIDGKKGVFPSLVVEEMGASGDNLLSPDQVGPPPFTPPDLGPPPPQLEITQPTPSDEMPPSPTERMNGDSSENKENKKVAEESDQKPQDETKVNAEEVKNCEGDTNKTEEEGKKVEESTTPVQSEEEVSTKTDDIIIEDKSKTPEPNADDKSKESEAPSDDKKEETKEEKDTKENEPLPTTVIGDGEVGETVI